MSTLETIFFYLVLMLLTIGVSGALWYRASKKRKFKEFEE